MKLPQCIARSTRRAPLSLRLRLRRGVGFVHLWLGLIVGAYLCVICFTGSILVFIDELRQLRMPELTHAVAAPGARAIPLPLADALRLARLAHPEIPAASFAHVNFPKAPGAAWSLQITEANFLDNRVVTVNPYTGAVMHDLPQYTPALRWLEALHIQLLLGAPGMAANSVGGLLAGALLATGLWLWWPSRLRLLAQRLRVKTSAGANRLNYDLHNAIGIYTLPLLMIVSLSGAVFAFWTPVSKAVERATHSSSQPAAPKLPRGEGNGRLPFQRMLAIAQGAAPRGKIMSVDLPQKAGDLFVAHEGAAREGLLPLTSVSVDPATGRVLQVYSDSTAPLAHRVMYAAYALHFGWWGGMAMMIVYAAGGVLPLALYGTGILIWARKRRRGAGAASAGVAVRRAISA